MYTNGLVCPRVNLSLGWWWFRHQCGGLMESLVSEMACVGERGDVKRHSLTLGYCKYAVLFRCLNSLA